MCLFCLKAGVPISDDGMLVGEPDGQSFGVGIAPKASRAEPSSVVQLKKKEDERKRKEKGRGARRYDIFPYMGIIVSQYPNVSIVFRFFVLSSKYSLRCIILNKRYTSLSNLTS